MDKIRNHCRQIMNKIAERECGLTLDWFPDLPCVMNALDEMCDLIEQEGDMASMSELEGIAQDAVFEVLEEEGFPI